MVNEEIKTASMPFALGIVSVILLGVCLWDAFILHASLKIVVIVIPFTSIIGLISSLIIRKHINKHKAIWFVGFLCSLLSFIGFFVIEVLALYNMGLGLG